jgi:hypothetical protein
MVFSFGLISFLAAISISTALPVSNHINKCNDAREYYTTTRIVNYSILYSITTYDNKTQTNTTESILYNNPTFEDYLDLITPNTNITLFGKVIFEYEILAPCYYTCAMDILANEYTSKTIAKHFENYYQPGRQYTMMCSSYGCRAGVDYCKTFQTHDEL